MLDSCLSSSGAPGMSSPGLLFMRSSALGMRYITGFGPVNTPPSGGPTSSPKISVTPSRDSPTCSAMRIAWIIVATSALTFARREHVLPDRLRRRLRLRADPLGRLGELVDVLRAQLIHL